MLKVLSHPLIDHKLTIMRDKESPNIWFRENLDEIGSLMVYEALRDLETKDVEIETPMGKCIGKKLAKDVALVPILRAGLGMVAGIQALVPTAKIAHIGI